MNLDFLKSTGSSLLTVAVVGLVGYATQITVLGKDIERIAESIDEINEELENNYDKRDADKDNKDIQRTLESVNERIQNTEERIHDRINSIEERISRQSKIERK